MVYKYLDAKDEHVIAEAALTSDPELGELVPVAGQMRRVIKVAEQIDKEGRIYNAVYTTKYV